MYVHPLTDIYVVADKVKIALILLHTTVFLAPSIPEEEDLLL